MRALLYVIVVLALAAMLWPFYYIGCVSIEAAGEIARGVPTVAPRSPFLSGTTLRIEGTAPALSAALEASAAVVQYSVEPGRVTVLYDSRYLGADGLRALVEQQGSRVLAVAPPERYDIWTNYRAVFEQSPFLSYLRNSAIVASATTLFCLGLGALCAYAAARLRFRGRDLVLALILGVAMFPPIAVVSPLFLLLKWLHLLNTYSALVIPYTAFGLPLTVWVLTGFFKELPTELEEAARVDGCSRLQTFWRVILPLAAPGVFTCAILVFIFAWNEFMFALVFVTKNSLRTVPVGITMFPGQFEMPWGTVFAAATLVTLPLVIVVFAFQQRIISGLTSGAVKG